MSAKRTVKGEQDEGSREMEGLREFMTECLPEAEVFAVLKASSCGTINAKTKDEAIAEIVKWSDAVTVLNRQRVKKDYLLRYLIKKDIKASIKDTKTALCQAVLKSWKSKENLKDLQFPETSQQKPTLQQAAPLKRVISSIGGTSQTTITNFLSKAAVEPKEPKPKIDEIPKPAVTANDDEAKPAADEPSKSAQPAIDSSRDFKKPKLDETVTKICAKTATIPTTSSESLDKDKSTDPIPKPNLGNPNNCTSDKPTCTTVSIFTDHNAKVALPSQENISPMKSITATCEVGTNTEPCTILSLVEGDDEEMSYELCIELRLKELELGQRLGLEFSKWYYERFNSMEDFIAAHFLNECNLRVEYITNKAIYNSKLTEFLHDGQRCFEEMCYLRTKKNLYLNPNLMTGIRGKMNPHGLAQIMVCGTFHSPDATGQKIGVFDQIFGLMRDPSCIGSDNFKIKFSMLRLREDNHIVMGVDQPTILDFSLDGILEEAKENNTEVEDCFSINSPPGLGLD